MPTKNTKKPKQWNHPREKTGAVLSIHPIIHSFVHHIFYDNFKLQLGMGPKKCIKG